MAINLINPIGFLTPFGPRKINSVPLDVVIEESVDHSVSVTKHPIEVPSGTGVSRGSVADHAFIEPLVYTMRGGVSDFPISWRAFENRYANTSAETRSISAYQLLLKHLNEREPFSLETPFGTLENMLFRRFRVNRTASTKHAIVFFAEIVELQIVVPSPTLLTRTPETVAGEQAQTQAVEEVKQGPVVGKTEPEGSVLTRRKADPIMGGR